MISKYDFGDNNIMEVSWKRKWKGFTIRIGGHINGPYSQKQLLDAIEIPLRDNSNVKVQLVPRGGLVWTRNDQLFPGPGCAELSRVTGIAGILIFLGIANLLFGLIGNYLDIPLYLRAIWLAAGAIYTLMGFLARRKSKTAISIAMIILVGSVCSNVITIMQSVGAGSFPLGIPGIVIQIGFIVAIYKGFAAIDSLKRMESGNRRGELKKVLQGGAQKTADVRAREKQEDTTLRVEDEKWPIIEPAWTPGKQKVRTGKPSWRLIAGMLGAVCVLLAVCVGLYLWGRSPMSPLSENIVIATDASWPPMEMVDENKNIVGFDIDLMKAAAKASGFTVEFKNIAWEDIFAGLENNNYDAVMSSVIITDERKKTMDFSIPYINAGQILIVKRETTGVVKLSDLEGKTAGAQKGTTGAFEIEKNKTIKEKTYEEIGLAIEDLANSQVDGVVCDTPTAVQFVLRNPNYNGKLKIVGEPLTEEYCGVAVKRGNRKVLDKINSGLHKVLDSGESKQIRERWLQ